MAGVKPFSVGRGSIAGRLALVGRTERIWRASQPAVFIHNGSRLGHRGRRAFVGPVQWQVVDAPGDSRIRIPVVDGILDRTNVF